MILLFNETHKCMISHTLESHDDWKYERFRFHLNEKFRGSDHGTGPCGLSIVENSRRVFTNVYISSIEFAFFFFLFYMEKKLFDTINYFVSIGMR